MVVFLLLIIAALLYVIIFTKNLIKLMESVNNWLERKLKQMEEKRDNKWK